MDTPGRADVGASVPDRTFRLGFVPGATPAKWARIWQQRHRSVALELVPIAASAAAAAVIAGDLDAAIMRPPVDRDALHAITLYTEVPVVVFSRDHVLAALEADEPVELADLVDEVVLQPGDDVLLWAGGPGAASDAIATPGRAPAQIPESTADAVALVAAGIGVLVVPQSLARLHHRKDVTARPLEGGPGSPVALVWAIDREDDRTEDLIGIVRGRTVNSSRGRPQQPAQPRKPAATGRTSRPRSRRGRR